MRHKQSEAAFSLIELMIVLAIVGVLIGMLVPAVQRARETVNRTQCANNLVQMGRAMHGYHDVYHILPPALFDVVRGNVTERANHTGFTLLLPFLEHEDLYRQYDFNYPSCDALRYLGESVVLAGGGVENCPGNTEVVGTYIKIYHCPSDQMPDIDDYDADPRFVCTNARRSNYLFSAGSDQASFSSFMNRDTSNRPRGGIFSTRTSARFKQIQDGLANTIAIGETRQRHTHPDAVTPSPKTVQFAVHWGAGNNFGVMGVTYQQFLVTIAGNWARPLPMNGTQMGHYPMLPGGIPGNDLPLQRQFGSWHTSGANYLFANSAVRYLRNDIDLDVFLAMSTACGQDNAVTE